MRKSKPLKKEPVRAAVSVSSDFYGSGTGETPLYIEAGRPKGSARKTTRHRAVTGKRKENADQRDKLAMMAILKWSVLLVVLLMVLLLTKFALSSVEKKRAEEALAGAQNGDGGVLNIVISGQNPLEMENPVGKESMASMVDDCENTERLLNTANSFVLQGNIDAAVEKCIEVLKINPVHSETLELLGELYFRQGKYAASANAYTYLVRTAPDREYLQQYLLRSLAALGELESVIQVASWYHQNNEYNHDVQNYIAQAYFDGEHYEMALTAYERLLKEKPKDVDYLTIRSEILVRLDRYEDALTALEKLQSVNGRDSYTSSTMALCYAQLGKAFEAVQVMEQSAVLFGRNTVISWLEDSKLDPIRSDRGFMIFDERIRGAEFQQYLASIEAKMREREAGISIDIGLPDTGSGSDNPLLNRNGINRP
ncbi:MAG: tetratricopeptide repeat protein [Pontiellaceae bacterium]|nr:tetratricopeptide repeat protein [Pontiellaceae bacterium]